MWHLRTDLKWNGPPAVFQPSATPNVSQTHCRSPEIQPPPDARWPRARVCQGALLGPHRPTKPSQPSMMGQSCRAVLQPRIYHSNMQENMTCNTLIKCLKKKKKNQSYCTRVAKITGMHATLIPPFILSLHPSWKYLLKVLKGQLYIFSQSKGAFVLHGWSQSERRQLLTKAGL